MNNCPDKNPLQREGLSQFQRALAALQPDYIKVDERTITDLMAFAAAYAQDTKIRFFDLTGSPDNGETWQVLMDYKQQFKTQDILQELNSRSDFPPHFALFLCFLKLFFNAQNDINTLTKRHLDFYYKDVLQLTNKAPVADRVHIVFTLAKNAFEQIIGKNTELDGGKDALKLPLLYNTSDNLTVNRAKIAHQRSVFIDNDKKVYYAPAANTQDGIEKALDENNPSWNAFGPKPKSQATCGIADNSIALPIAQIGFALASPVLEMAEGTRKITVVLTMDTPLSIPADFGLNIQLSGEKNWIDVKSADITINNNSIPTAANLPSGSTLTIVATVGADEKNGVVNFNPNKLDGGYKTTFPVMRCWISNSEHYPILRGVTLTNAKITVEVSGIKKSLTLENDLGKINAEKPFMPFGPVPVVGSKFYVGCEEALNKTLESVTVRFTGWVGDISFSSIYEAYDSKYQSQANFKATTEIINGNLKRKATPDKGLFSDFNAGVRVSNSAVLSTGDYLWNWYFGASYHKGGYLRTGNVLSPINVASVLGFSKAPTLASTTVSDSLLKISLNQDFGHGVYPKLLSLGVIDQAKRTVGPQKIPNPPYTPLASECLLSYKASTDTVVLEGTALPNNATDAQKEQARQDLFKKFSQRDLQLFHLGIFGQAEEHAFLKQDLNFLDNTDKNSAYLLPQYSDNGTFYIALQDVEALESVSILFQISEGSANPERPTATTQWSVLSHNQWRPLSSEDILSDTTHNLLVSGIIKFYLPTETTSTNTLFDPNFVWLKAELVYPATKTTPVTSAPIDSVCNFIALHTQAVLAKFKDNSNDPVHYANPLLAQTIKKSRTSLGSIKKIEQPYASFGNKPQETDTAFQQRISERLRHKQRAITIWDYEHLVLQTYPSVFKAKCLNHTYLDKNLPAYHPNRLEQLAPGNVTMVVVPDLRYLKAINPLEPKVDLNTLAQIKIFLKKHAGMLVNIETTNPDYEPVRLQFNVQFRRGYEFSVYKKVLNQDIIRYLSPWAFDTGADIPFGGTLEKSVVINFIERLGYVDVVREFKLLSIKDNFSYDYEEIVASNPMAVLVSCGQHNIEVFGTC
jgi:hypothetical protein